MCLAPASGAVPKPSLAFTKISEQYVLRVNSLLSYGHKLGYMPER